MWRALRRYVTCHVWRRSGVLGVVRRSCAPHHVRVVVWAHCGHCVCPRLAHARHVPRQAAQRCVQRCASPRWAQQQRARRRAQPSSALRRLSNRAGSSRTQRMVLLASARHARSGAATACAETCVAITCPAMQRPVRACRGHCVWCALRRHVTCHIRRSHGLRCVVHRVSALRRQNLRAGSSRTLRAARLAPARRVPRQAPHRVRSVVHSRCMPHDVRVVRRAGSSTLRVARLAPTRHVPRQAQPRRARRRVPSSRALRRQRRCGSVSLAMHMARLAPACHVPRQAP
jgi:hypothetical protein